MDGENNGKPYCLRDDLGGTPTMFGNIQVDMQPNISKPLSQENQAAKNSMETRLLTLWDCRHALPK